MRLTILLRSDPGNTVMTAQMQEAPPGEWFYGAQLLAGEQGFDVQLDWPNALSTLGGKVASVANRTLGFTLSLDMCKRLLRLSSQRDVIMATGPTWYFQLGLLRAMGFLRRVRCVAVTFGLPSRLHAQSTFRRQFLVRLLNHLDVIVVNTEVEAEDLATLDVYNAYRVKYGVDPDFWHPDGHDWTAGEFVFSPGTDPRRDWRTLINACPRPLVLATPNLPLNPASLPPHVTLTAGTVADMRDLYRRCRILAVTLPESRRIAGENTVLQGMAMARPVVVTRTAGTSLDIIRDRETCFTVPPEDVAVVRETLEMVWRGGEEVNRVAQRGRQLVVEECNARRFVDDLAAVLRGETLRTRAMSEAVQA